MKKEPDFLCTDCGHRGAGESFGDHVLCPKCRSHNVVMADVWVKFSGATETAEQDDKNRS